MTLLVVGDLMTDVVALASGPLATGSDTGARVRITGGGSAANTAAWLGATGHPVSYVGRIGRDVLGHQAVADLVACRVDVRVVTDPGRATGCCVVVVTPDGERSMLPDAGANAGLAVSDLPDELLERGGHLHLSGYSLLTEGSRPGALAMLQRCRQAGFTVSVDPASVHPVAAVGVDRFLDWVAGADLLLPNEAEARLLARGGPRADPVAAGRALLDRFRAVVVKLGADGAAWCGPDERTTVTVPAAPATVVDTTGAGDTFAAGFLPAWLSGRPPAEALAAGCALAARCVAVPGGRPPS